MTSTSLKHLLGECLDYAGLFPPAELRLDAAIRNYLAYQAHPQSWMLARFVCPVARLSELDSLLPNVLPGGPVRLSVLGRLDKYGNTPLANLEAELEKIGELRAKKGDRVRIELYETPVPMDYVHCDVVALGELEQSFQAAFGSLLVFLEAAKRGKLETAFTESPDFLADSENNPVRLGWKVRLGGVDPSVVPSPSDMAEFVVACVEDNCIWKATAGLHQPLGAWDAGHITFQFGFLTLLAASVLAQIHELRPDRVQEILEETNIASFHFDDHGFTWRNLPADNQQIVAARKQSLISFGSCSFEEPVAGLEQLRLLGSGAGHE